MGSSVSRRLSVIVGAGAIGLFAIAGAHARTAQMSYDEAFHACETTIAADVGVAPDRLQFQLRNVKSRSRFIRVAYLVSVRGAPDVRTGADCVWRVRGGSTQVAYDGSVRPTRFANRARAALALLQARESVSVPG